MPSSSNDLKWYRVLASWSPGETLVRGEREKDLPEDFGFWSPVDVVATSPDEAMAFVIGEMRRLGHDWNEHGPASVFALPDVIGGEFRGFVPEQDHGRGFYSGDPRVRRATRHVWNAFWDVIKRARGVHRFWPGTKAADAIKQHALRLRYFEAKV
ncbi:MAG: hypothetical protein AAGI53_00905 [Planctomycetota bacterium]